MFQHSSESLPLASCQTFIKDKVNIEIEIYGMLYIIHCPLKGKWATTIQLQFMSHETIHKKNKKNIIHLE